MIPPEIAQSIRNILDYNWSDELDDWEAEGKPEEGHIFLDLQEVRDWLDVNR